MPHRDDFEANRMMAEAADLSLKDALAIEK
jgi:hypothetical protein